MLKGFAVLAGMRALVVKTGAEAQAAYPTKPIRIIVPFTPGGSTEILGLAGYRIARRFTGEGPGRPVPAEMPHIE